TGFHPFRFPLAERGAEGWQLVERPERLPANRGDMRRLESIWQRIWQQEPALPLAAWAAELNGKAIR
ncbi:MAG TPA: hydrolase, partial [Pseudomonas sp.]|nr:hydrolase [Pseudomonas sp.]